MLSVQDVTAWRTFALTSFIFYFLLYCFLFCFYAQSTVILVAKWLLSRLCFRDFQWSIFNKWGQKSFRKKQRNTFLFYILSIGLVVLHRAGFRNNFCIRGIPPQSTIPRPIAKKLRKVQELGEGRAGRPGLPVPNKPHGFCGREAARNQSNRLTHV